MQYFSFDRTLGRGNILSFGDADVVEPIVVTAEMVANNLIGGGGGVALSYAMSQLIDDDTDWVIDAPTNSVKYNKKSTLTDSYGVPIAFGTVFTAGGSCSQSSSYTPSGCCTKWAANAAGDVGKVLDGGRYGVCEARDSGFTASIVKDTTCPLSAVQGSPSDIYTLTDEYMPIITVAEKVVANADDGHAESIEFINSLRGLE